MGWEALGAEVRCSLMASPPKHFVAHGWKVLWLNALLSYLSSALFLTGKVLSIRVNRGNRGLSPSYAIYG